jgi:hypothetical protein
MLFGSDARLLTQELALAWLHNHGYRVEKGLIRMDERTAHRDLVNKATMKIGNEYVADVVPERYVRTLAGKLICLVPGETLPRYAKRLRDSMQIDVAVGDQAYYAYDESGRAGRQRGRKYLAWWYSDTHAPLDFTQITMKAG